MESMAEASSKATDFDSLLSGSKHKQKTAMDFIVDGETTVSVKVKGTRKFGRGIDGPLSLKSHKGAVRW
jgi:hypothetical protein